jgi:hypothetical protein
MSHSEERFHCHPSVVFTRLNDTEAVLLHLETKRYYSLNETGARLWELLATTELPDALWQKIADEYEMDAKTSRACIQDFLEDLRCEGLVECR